MTRAPLTKLQTEILLSAYDGKTNRQIAGDTGRTRNCIATTLSHIKSKGYRMPDWRPREPTAERKHRVRERRIVAASIAAPRFTAEGVKASTGERFTVTADDQAFADAHLAAMVGGG